MLTKMQKQIARLFYEGRLHEPSVLKEFHLSPARLQQYLDSEPFQQELQRLCARSLQETRYIVTRFGPIAALRLAELLASDKDDTVRRTALDLVDRCLQEFSDKKTPAEPDTAASTSNSLSDEQTRQLLLTLAANLQETAAP